MENDTPYSAPTSGRPIWTREELVRKKKSWNRVRWISWVVFLIPIIPGGVAATSNVLRAFGDASNAGIGDPTKLAETIGEAIITLAVSLIFALPGLILLIFSVFRLRFWRKQQQTLPV